MSHFATFSQNGNKSHHQLLFKKGDLELYLPSNYARRSIDTLFPNGFTQHWTLLGISFPPYFSTTLLLLSFSRRRNFMPNYLGNSDTKCNIFLQVNFALAKIFLPLFTPGVPLVFTWLSLSRIRL